ncbi:MAG: DUF3458 domain-containing protein, partial [Pseudomonadota bacterium]|nr:DUF3458 domain-containing protein [Pseudomonadota bacterium]
HTGQVRQTGDAYITHPIAVAQILAEYGLDRDTLAAALMHDVVEDTEVSLDDLEADFGLAPSDVRKRFDFYFERFDGQAVTTDDFVAVMEEAGSRDFTQFKRWYSQAGTPRVEVDRGFNPEQGILTLTLRQHCPPTPEQPEKAAFVIPLRMALFDREGNRLSLNTDQSQAEPGATETVLELTEREQRFVFHGLAEEPVPSLLRGFSAPVVLEQSLDRSELALLLSHDDDPFNRWEAGQKLALGQLLEMVATIEKVGEIALDPMLFTAFDKLLQVKETDGAFHARMLELPAESYIGESMAVVEPVAIHQARGQLKKELGLALRERLETCYAQQAEAASGGLDWHSIAARSLRDACLGYLVAIDDAAAWQLAKEQLEQATCMTDTIAAITALAHSGAPSRRVLLDAFHDRWRNEALVVDKWLRIQATAPGSDTLSRVRSLTGHGAFDAHNPNKVYSLIGAFCLANPGEFHRLDGAGYAFLTEWVLRLDPLNPQVASRLVSAFNDWRRYSPERQQAMQHSLQQIAAHPGLSTDVGEIVSKALGDCRER